MKYLTNGILAIGILLGVLGVLVFEFATDFFGSSIEISSEFVAAILGASIALAGTMLTLLASKEQIEEERKDKDRALVLSTFVKMQKITNNLWHLRDHIESSYENVSQESHDNPGLFVQALASHPDPITFTPEEKAAFIRWGMDDLSNIVSEMDGIHNSLISAFEKYTELRHIFTSTTPATMDGIVASSSFTAKELKLVAPQIAQLNDLILKLRERSKIDYPYAVESTQKVLEALPVKAGIKLDLEFPE